MDLFKILWLCCQLQWAYCFFPTQLRSWVWSKFVFSVTTLAPLVATWPELSSFQTMAAAFDLQRKLSTKCLWNLELFIALSFPQVSTGCWRLNANLTIEEFHIRLYKAGVNENIFTVFANSLVDWIDIKTVTNSWSVWCRARLSANIADLGDFLAFSVNQFHWITASANESIIARLSARRLSLLNSQY